MSTLLTILASGSVGLGVGVVIGGIYGRKGYTALLDEAADLKTAFREAKGSLDTARARINLMKPDYDLGVSRRKSMEKAKTKEKAAREAKAAPRPTVSAPKSLKTKK